MRVYGPSPHPSSSRIRTSFFLFVQCWAIRTNKQQQQQQTNGFIKNAHNNKLIILNWKRTSYLTTSIFFPFSSERDIWEAWCWNISLLFINPIFVHLRNTAKMFSQNAEKQQIDGFWHVAFCHLVQSCHYRLCLPPRFFLGDYMHCVTSSISMALRHRIENRAKIMLCHLSSVPQRWFIASYSSTAERTLEFYW